MISRRRAIAASRIEILQQDLAEGIHQIYALKAALEAFSVEASLALKDFPEAETGEFDDNLLAISNACDEATVEVLLIANRGKSVERGNS
jgi:hypothetical protein